MGEDAIRAAVAAGYRAIDTAAIYGNEDAVGRAIADSGLARDEFVVTTKRWNDSHGHDAALRAFEDSRARLGLDVVDLYLIHWPQPRLDRYVETWRAFERLHEEGAVRAIGVSNFLPDHLERLLAECDVPPALNQVELHPHHACADLRALHAEHAIVTEAYSPLAQGGDVLDDPAIAAIAERHGATPAQVAIRWSLQLGNVVIPRSSNPDRIAQNLDVFGFELSDDEVDAISGLDRGDRIGPDPRTF